VERIGVRERIKRGFGRSRGTATTTAHHQKTPSGYKEDKKSEYAIKKKKKKKKKATALREDARFDDRPFGAIIHRTRLSLSS